MKLFHHIITGVSLCALLSSPVAGADAPSISAKELAAKLSEMQQDGSSFVRLKIEVKPGSSVQLQIKQRRTRSSVELVYQVLWPKERQGEALLLKQSGNEASASALIPPGAVRPVKLKDSLFGSDLTCADVLENFFAWDNQAIVGAEVVDGVNCQILESKPGKGDRSSAASVRSWIDIRRTVPLRVEKFAAGGASIRRIDTTRVVTDDKGRHVPANLIVRTAGKGSVTEIEGSKLKHGSIYTDRDFSPEGLADMTPPKSE